MVYLDTTDRAVKSLMTFNGIKRRCINFYQIIGIYTLLFLYSIEHGYKEIEKIMKFTLSSTGMPVMDL